jgi:hypothetical protein
MQRAMATSSERKKYVLAKKADFEILGKCKLLEKRKLSKNAAATVKLIKTQLKKDWRRPLIVVLNRLLKKYRYVV